MSTPRSDAARHFQAGKALRVSLWVVQGLACAGFTAVGLVKLLTPIAELAAMWPWTGELPVLVVRSLAIIDIAGGLGVLLPSLTRIKPGLTVVAAACCVVLQVCALVFHLLRGEAAAAPVNVLFLGLVAFVLWGRQRAPVRQR